MTTNEAPRKPRPAGWVILLLSFLIGLLCLGLAVYASWFGMGTYLPARILFPWTMASTAFTGLIATPFLVFAAIQFPLYGLSLLQARRSGVSMRMAGALLLALHAVGIALAFWLSNPAF